MFSPLRSFNKTRITPITHSFSISYWKHKDAHGSNAIRKGNKRYRFRRKK